MSEQEIPESVYEMDTDEMIEWLSSEEVTEETEPSIISPVEVNDISDVRYLISKYESARRQGEPVDPVLEEYILDNLHLLSLGQRAWNVGRSGQSISWEDKRWRLCAMQLLCEAGATHLHLSEIIGVSERTIFNWLNEWRNEQFFGLKDVKEYMLELVELPLVNKDYKEACKVINSIRPLI
ncbi:helix-turn-helix domain-containing protein [Vibrio europaeus]|uniref:helix-turn-helix domain-containing protein n=1 Tax=Vibrio europaeus TaxID=300876 RepID=UPI0039E143EC